MLTKACAGLLLGNSHASGLCHYDRHPHYSTQAGGVKIAPPGFAISQPARRARAENGYQVIFTFFGFLRAALGRVI